jgi:hypothetical protein
MPSSPETHYVLTTRGFVYFCGFNEHGSPIWREVRDEAKQMSLAEAAGIADALHATWIDALIEPVWADADFDARKFITELRSKKKK